MAARRSPPGGRPPTAASARLPASSRMRVSAAASAYVRGLVAGSGPPASGSSAWTGGRGRRRRVAVGVGQQGQRARRRGAGWTGIPAAWRSRAADRRAWASPAGSPVCRATLAEDVQGDVVDVAVASVADLVRHLDRRLGLGPGVREPPGAEQGAEPQHGPDADVGRYPVPLGGLHPGVDERERLVEAGDGDGDQRLPRVRQPQPDRCPRHAVPAGDRLAPTRSRASRQSPRAERLRGPRDQREHLVLVVAARLAPSRWRPGTAFSAALASPNRSSPSDRNDSRWIRSAVGHVGQVQRPLALLDDVGGRVLHRQVGEAEPGLGLGRRVGEVARGGGHQPDRLGGLARVDEIGEGLGGERAAAGIAGRRQVQRPAAEQRWPPPGTPARSRRRPAAGSRSPPVSPGLATSMTSSATSDGGAPWRSITSTAGGAGSA